MKKAIIEKLNAYTFKLEETILDGYEVNEPQQVEITCQDGSFGSSDEIIIGVSVGGNEIFEERFKVTPNIVLEISHTFNAREMDAVDQKVYELLNELNQQGQMYCHITSGDNFWIEPRTDGRLFGTNALHYFDAAQILIQGWADCDYEFTGEDMKQLEPLTKDQIQRIMDAANGGMFEITDTQHMVEMYDNTFTSETEWIFVEKVDVKKDIETLKVRWSDGNNVHEFEANQKDFIRECLEQSDQI